MPKDPRSLQATTVSLSASPRRHKVRERTTHANSEEGSHAQERLESLRVGSGELQHGNDEKVHDHGPFAAVEVTGKAKDCCANGTAFSNE